MQKISTRVFIIASLVFGIAGILFINFTTGPDSELTGFGLVLQKTLMTCVFIILPSFALSVAAKYLKDK